MKRIAWLCLVLLAVAMIGCQQGSTTKSGSSSTPAPATGGATGGGSGGTSGSSGEAGK
ncbi:MAG: hypothetical protein KatS3mg110_0550 [Pirellulaceae bacterium]|nr:MAG: hypothetical protein KatS3mg110_0550 [Pirellulaceae bacterium]